MARKVDQPVTQNQLGRWRLLREFNRCLAPALKSASLPATWQDPERWLEISDYLGLFLLGVFNPVIKSMRGLCRASHLRRVQREACGRAVSKSSFSEAQAAVDPGLLKSVYDQLAREVAQGRPCPGPEDNRYRAIMQIVDSSLWYALPRMHWALWRHQHGTRQRAFRLHVIFQVIDLMPARMSLRAARRCERLEWEELAQAGEFYVGDRNYGEDYRLLGRFQAKGCSFAVRLRSNAQWVVEEELPLREADRQQGVVWQGWVRLGKHGTGPRVRVVQILGEQEALWIATDLSPEQMSAELVSLCYRQRWLIELFFRWLKHLMRANHWMAESQNGVAIQLYLTLIAAQLLLLFSGERPNRATLELLQFMVMGWASPEEVLTLIQREKVAAQKKSR